MVADRPRRIVLGVTGGIAAYKSPDVVRRLRDRGHEVRVVMTAGALRFVTALPFQAVSGNPVASELLDERAEAAMGHIELARWADLVLVAPATAHCMAQLAAGLAGDLLSTLCLATTAPVALAPAMNQQMWQAAATQANRATLAARGVHFLGPGAGSQACGEVGAGRMWEPVEIAEAVDALGSSTSPPSSPAGEPGGVLAGLSVLVTAGPTREPIDPVRYISNNSSGKMGYAVAAAARALGARVVLVSGPTALAPPPGVELVPVQSAQQMYEAVIERAGAADLYVSAAAVADYAPARAAASKMKKSERELVLPLVRTRDILAAVAALPQSPFTVGFAAETNDMRDNARKKLAGKALDMIAGNDVSVPGIGFDSEENALTVLWEGGEQELPRASKPAIARALLELAAARYRESRARDPHQPAYS